MKKSKLILAVLCALFAMVVVAGCTNAASGTGGDNSGNNSGSGGTSTAVDFNAMSGKVYFMQGDSGSTPGSYGQYLYFTSSTSVDLVSKSGTAYGKSGSTTFNATTSTGTMGNRTGTIKSAGGTIIVYTEDRKCTRVGTGTGITGQWTIDGTTLTVTENTVTYSIDGNTTSLPYTNTNGFIVVSHIANGNDGYGYFDGQNLYTGIYKLVEVTDTAIINSVKTAPAIPNGQLAPFAGTTWADATGTTYTFAANGTINYMDSECTYTVASGTAAGSYVATVSLSGTAMAKFTVASANATTASFEVYPFVNTPGQVTKQ